MRKCDLRQSIKGALVDIFWRIKMIPREFFTKLRVNGHLLGKVITLGWSIYIWSNSPKKSWLGHYPTFFWQCQDFESAWSRYPSNQWLEWGQATSSMFSVDIFNGKSYPIQVSKIAQSTELVGDGQGKTMTGHQPNENSHYWLSAASMRFVKEILVLFSGHDIEWKRFSFSRYRWWCHEM